MTRIRVTRRSLPAAQPVLVFSFLSVVFTVSSRLGTLHFPPVNNAQTHALTISCLPLLQSRVTSNGRVGATSAVYTAAILGEFSFFFSWLPLIGQRPSLENVYLMDCRVPDSRSAGAGWQCFQGLEGKLVLCLTAWANSGHKPLPSPTCNLL